ncbi:MAG: IclR family transcriptional regulator [Mycobacterium sp.]
MSSTVGSLERGLRILDLLFEVSADPVRREKGLSVQQAASELDIHKSSASRLMQTLAAAGYAVPVSETRRGFRLGPAVLAYSGIQEVHQRFAEAARPHLVRLVEETGECAHAAVSTGAAALVIDDVETTRPLRVVAGKGRRVPLHCTSAGKCLLAVGLAAVPADLPPRTTRTITSAKVLAAHVEDIASRGYAIDDEENDMGVRCISAPVYDGPDGAPVGVIGIDGPATRLTPESLKDLAAHVVAVAADITAALGGRSAVTGTAG